jgi:MFS family permease
MPDIESHIFDITRAIQLAVAPVFLLTAIGTIINALTGRLARAVERRRQLEDLLPAYEGEAHEDMLMELVSIARRIRLTLWSIALAVVSALFVCLLISFAFVGGFVELDLARIVAGLFIASMVALTLCLLLFLREVFVAALNVRHPSSQADRLARKDATAEVKKASESAASAAPSLAEAPGSDSARTTPSAK